MNAIEQKERKLYDLKKQKYKLSDQQETPFNDKAGKHTKKVIKSVMHGLRGVI